MIDLPQYGAADPWRVRKPVAKMLGDCCSCYCCFDSSRKKDQTQKWQREDTMRMSSNFPLNDLSCCCCLWDFDLIFHLLLSLSLSPRCKETYCDHPLKVGVFWMKLCNYYDCSELSRTFFPVPVCLLPLSFSLSRLLDFYLFYFLKEQKWNWCKNTDKEKKKKMLRHFLSLCFHVHFWSRFLRNFQSDRKHQDCVKLKREMLKTRKYKHKF